MRFYPIVCIFFVLLLITWAVGISPGWAQNKPEKEEDIETLDVIEVTGQSVEKINREVSFPLPEFPQPLRAGSNVLHMHSTIQIHTTVETTNQILRDQTAMNQKIYQPVTPLKTERPPYPRIARENGWHGRVILRVKISSQGTVTTASIQETSGFSVLDESALQVVQDYTFVPAKNGEFPVTSIVDLPIQFDLLH